MPLTAILPELLVVPGVQKRNQTEVILSANAATTLTEEPATADLTWLFMGLSVENLAPGDISLTAVSVDLNILGLIVGADTINHGYKPSKVMALTRATPVNLTVINQRPIALDFMLNLDVIEVATSVWQAIIRGVDGSVPLPSPLQRPIIEPSGALPVPLTVAVQIDVVQFQKDVGEAVQKALEAYSRR